MTTHSFRPTREQIESAKEFQRQHSKKEVEWYIRNAYIDERTHFIAEKELKMEGIFDNKKVENADFS